MKYLVIENANQGAITYEFNDLSKAESFAKKRYKITKEFSSSYLILNEKQEIIATLNGNTNGLEYVE